MWAIDGIERHRTTAHVPAEAMILYLSTTVLGDWTGDPETGTWPRDHLIDYVRVCRDEVPLRSRDARLARCAPVPRRKA